MKNRLSVIAIGAAAVLLLFASVGVAAHDSFSDVSEGDAHADAIHWASENGIVNGYEDGTFKPGQDVSRAQVASMLNRFNNSSAQPAAGPQGPQGPQGPRGPQGPAGPQGPPGDDAVPNVTTTSMNTATFINIGGSVEDRCTQFPSLSQSLDAGRYQITVQGAFDVSDGNSGTDYTKMLDTKVWPQLSLYLDRNNDGDLDWFSVNDPDNEGLISPNALSPKIEGRHISAHGTLTVDLANPQELKVCGFGYAKDTGTDGSGEVRVRYAQLQVTPLQ